MILIPLFFIDTGMRIELDVLTGQLLVWIMAGAPIAPIAAVLVGKSAAAWLTGRLYGYSRTDRTLMIGLTLPQAAATLAVTVTASEAGAFDKVVVDAVVVVILVTCLIGPLLSRHAGRKLVLENQQGKKSPIQEPKKDLS